MPRHGPNRAWMHNCTRGCIDRIQGYTLAQGYATDSSVRSATHSGVEVPAVVRQAGVIPAVHADSDIGLPEVLEEGVATDRRSGLQHPQVRRIWLSYVRQTPCRLGKLKTGDLQEADIDPIREVREQGVATDRRPGYAHSQVHRPSAGFLHTIDVVPAGFLTMCDMAGFLATVGFSVLQAGAIT